MYIIIGIIFIVIIILYNNCSHSIENMENYFEIPYYKYYNYPRLWYNQITSLPFNNPTRYYGNRYLYPNIEMYYRWFY